MRRVELFIVSLPKSLKQYAGRFNNGLQLTRQVEKDTLILASEPILN
jgi:hypothetical protein